MANETGNSPHGPGIKEEVEQRCSSMIWGLTFPFGLQWRLNWLMKKIPFEVKAVLSTAMKI